MMVRRKTIDTIDAQKGGRGRRTSFFVGGNSEPVSFYGNSAVSWGVKHVLFRGPILCSQEDKGSLE